MSKAMKVILATFAFTGFIVPTLFLLWSIFLGQEYTWANQLKGYSIALLACLLPALWMYDHMTQTRRKD